MSKNRTVNGSILKDVNERKRITDMLVELPWEWYCFMNLLYGDSCEDAEAYINEWRMGLSTEKGIEIGYWGIFDPVPYPHVHVMMLGMDKEGKNLFNKNSWVEQERLAEDLSQSAFIRPILDIEKVIKYILEKNTPSSSSEIFEPDYNPLLRRKRRLNDIIKRYVKKKNEHVERFKGEYYLRHIINEIWDGIDRSKESYILL
jgi:hypothetical protein